MEMIGLVAVMIVLYLLAGAALFGVDTHGSNDRSRHPHA
jgi:hypothetical protein